MPPSTAPVAPEDSLAVVVTEHWLDQFCEQVGSLCAVLQSLSRIPGNDRPHTLVSEALGTCAELQDLLNAIPVWGGRVSSPVGVPACGASYPPAGMNRNGEAFLEPFELPTPVEALGDCFPECRSDEDEQLPVLDQAALEDACGHDDAEMRGLVERFCRRAEDDLRELQLLSVGHEWTRLARLAGALKETAVRASAVRVVVDAAALQGAARVGCRNDVDLALDALRSDLRACAKFLREWSPADPAVREAPIAV